MPSLSANKLRLLFNRVLRAWRRRTLGDFARLVIYNLRLMLTGKHRFRNEAYDLAFDEEHGLDTVGREEVEFMFPDTELRVHGRGYEPAPVDRFRAVMQQLPDLRLSDYYFVDLGSGKGRALLLASHYPFRKIVGVEYSPSLHEIAEKNIAQFRSREQRPVDIELVCADASVFEFPAADTVCFMYHPFDDWLMRKTMHNILASLDRQPRKFYVIYLNTEHPQCFEEHRAWRRIAHGDTGGMPFMIWEWQDARATANAEAEKT
jgi:SAM-dependent methyltransferase